MNAEEKKILLKDLPARLAYNVEVMLENTLIVLAGETDKYYNYTLKPRHLELLMTRDDFFIKPYLRSLNTMTENEREELGKLCDKDLSEFAGHIIKGHGLSRDGLYMFDKLRQLEWLLEHHFDFRNLIGKGLAIEAPKNMYI